jgi:Holliday junction resolvase RusA-like endonuclease
MTSPRRQRGARTTGEARRSSASPVFLTLPRPPSVNDLWKNLKTGGRAETAIYRDWKGHAGWVLREQRPHHVPGPVVVIATVERNNAKADIDNREKAVLDLLVAHQVIADDSLVEAVAWSWTRGGNGLCHVAVIPAQAIAIEFHPATINGAPGGWIITAPIIEDDRYGEISLQPQDDEALPGAPDPDLWPAGSGQDIPRG